VRMKNLLFTNTVDSKLLKKTIQDMGASEVSFGDVSIGMAKELSHMTNAISIAIKHPPVMAQDATTYPFIKLSMAVDYRLLEIQGVITNMIRDLGWYALLIPPDSYRHDSSFISKIYKLFPHKTAATCAGLGWVGKSSLLINKNFGPRLSWATILTDAPLVTENEPVKESYCGQCRLCVEACPANAINDVHWKCTTSYSCMINVKRCAGQLQKNMERYGQYACGVCMLVCPKGRN